MSADYVPFHMHRLMGFTEIDAFSAQKNADSRAAYFTLLDEFTRRAPVVIKELADAGLLEAGTVNDGELFKKKLFELQKLLLPIGAMSLLWEAEIAMELGRKGEWDKCRTRIAILKEKITHLLEKLRSARISGATPPRPPARTSPNTAIIAIAQGAGDPARPRVPFGEQNAAKLRLLIENFETDQALELLRELMTSSYDVNIDPILARLYACLSGFDQDGAERQLKYLRGAIHAAGSNPGGGEKKKILAIDDMPEILNAIKSIAERDYSVYCVTGHKAAGKFLAANIPDLILLDIEMPDMNGFALMEIIRGMKEHELTPILFLTGNATVENIVRARRAGSNDFLKKPIDAQVLLSKIRKHIESR